MTSSLRFLFLPLLLAACTADDGAPQADGPPAAQPPHDAGSEVHKAACSGCMRGADCIPLDHQDEEVCGTAGASCGDCGDHPCASGACNALVLRDDVEVLFTFTDVAVDGDAWDNLSAPDPMLVVTRGKEELFRSIPCNDTPSCQLPMPFSILLPGAQLGELELRVEDDDLPDANDVCGSGKALLKLPLATPSEKEDGRQVFELTIGMAVVRGFYMVL